MKSFKNGSDEEILKKKRAPREASPAHQEGPSNELVLAHAAQQEQSEDASWLGGMSADEDLSWANQEQDEAEGGACNDVAVVSAPDRAQDAPGDPSAGPQQEPGQEGEEEQASTDVAVDGGAQQAAREGEQEAAAGGGGAGGPQQEEEAPQQAPAAGPAGGQQQEAPQTEAPPQLQGQRKAPPMQAAPQAGAKAVGSTTPQVQEPDSDAELAKMFEVYSGKTPDGHAASNASSLQAAANHIHGKQAELESHAASLCAQVDQQVEARVGNVQATLAASQSGMKAAFGSARGGVESGKAAALAQIEAGRTSALSAVDASEQQRKSELGTGFDAQTTRLQGVANTAKSEFSSTYAAKVQEIRGVGTEKADAARATGAQHAEAYRARGGSGIDGKRNRARADAATAVADQYATELAKHGNAMADEVGKGAPNVPSIVDQMVAPVSTELGKHKGEFEGHLGSVAGSGRDAVNEQANAAKAAVEQAANDASAQLTEQEAQSTADLQGAASNVQTQLRSAGEALKAQIRTVAGQLGQSYEQALQGLGAGLGAGGLPNSDDAADALNTVLGEIDAAIAGQFGQLNEMVSSGMADIDAQLQGSIGQIQSAASQAGKMATDASNEVSTGLGEASTEVAGQCEQIATGTNQGMGEMVTGALEAASGVVDATKTGLDTQKSEIASQLDQAKVSVGQQLDQALQKLPSDIHTEAEKAADKIQPLWKKIVTAVVAVVVAVVVTIAVAAFVVATFGAGAIVAGIIAGAVAGLASTFAADVTSSLLNGKWEFSSPRDYLASMVGGAIMGGLGGGLGPIIGKLSMSGKILAGTGMSFTGSLIGQGTDVFIKGEAFNWGEFLAGGALGAITGGLMTRFVPKSFEQSISRMLWARDGGNSWNNFQRVFAEFARIPTTPAMRAMIYNLISSKVGGTPEDIFKAIVEKGLIDQAVNPQEPYKPKVDVQIPTS